MALKNCVIASLLLLVYIFILTATIISAHQGSPSRPAASHTKCAKEHISVHLNETTTKTKEFLKNSILKHLHDPKTLKSDKPCLIRFFQAYHAAIASIEKASSDASKQEFSNSVVDVVAYRSFVASTVKLNCSSNLKSPNSEFAGMHKWVQIKSSDLLNRLLVCTNISNADAFAEPN